MLTEITSSLHFFLIL